MRRIGDALGELHEVHPFLYSTAEFLERSLLRMPWSVFRNREIECSLRELLRQNKFDVWQIHNVFPAMSPIVYRIALEQQVPIVHYLHSFRLGCVNGFFLNHGELCTRCIDGDFWPAFKTKCWHESHAKSGLMGLVLREVRQMGLFERVAQWVALSENHRLQHIRLGIPADRISVVPHFYTPLWPPLPPEPNGDALFVGRLSTEKGVHKLLTAWKILGRTDRRLIIIGDGPAAAELRAQAARDGLTNVVFTGFLSPSDQRKYIAGALFRVVPSIWLEPFGMVVLEAWANRRAVIANAIGGLPELVQDGQTGLLCNSSDPASIANAMSRLFDNPDLALALGTAGQNRLQTVYNKDVWLSKMKEIYDAL